MIIPGQRVIGQYVFYDASNESISVSLNSIDWRKDLFNLISDPILVADAKGNILMVNDSFARLRGVPKESLIGENVRDFDPPSRICDVLNMKKAFHGLSYRDGNTFYIVDIIPVLQNSNLLGAIMIIKDISVIEKMDDDYTGENIAKPWQYNENVKFIGEDPLIIKLKEKITKIAKSDLTILITGETGTGKELLAKSIHMQSSRQDGPFVPVNCSTFTPGIIDSELFGYDDGAFTGSKRGGKAGLFESANGGTLFLDEIGDLPIEFQPKLLRVLEEYSIRRVGSNINKPIDIRLVAATNKSIEELYKSVSFRSDLYYRLCGNNLNIPPLRERTSDIPILIKYFLKDMKKKTGKAMLITPLALVCMQSYSWPGNVRELKNVITSLYYLCDNGVIKKSDLPEHIIKSLNDSNIINPEPCLNNAFEMRKQLLFDYLKKHEYITNKDYCSLNRINRTTAYRDLSRLVIEGELTTVGMGRSTKYVKRNDSDRELF